MEETRVKGAMKRIVPVEDNTNVSKKMKSESAHGFKLVLVKFSLGIEPMYLDAVESAVDKHLSKWIGRYQSKLNAFCLAYFDGKKSNRIGGILGDCPTVYYSCQAKILLFYPIVKTPINIKIVSSSQHHIGGLLLGFIHVSIPKDYIPQNYEFVFDNSITGKWKTKNTSYSMGQIIECVIIGTKQDGHDMTLIATVATSNDAIEAYISAFSPTSITLDQLNLSSNDNSSDSSDDSDSSDSESSLTEPEAQPTEPPTLIHH